MNNFNIDEIIYKFKNKSKKQNPSYYYTHGGCYIFAKYLQQQIGGNIFYLTNYNHFILEYQNKYYDITGNVSKIYKNENMIKEEDAIKRKKIEKQILGINNYICCL